MANTKDNAQSLKGETVKDLLEGMSPEDVEDVKNFYGIIFGEDFPDLDAPADEPA